MRHWKYQTRLRLLAEAFDLQEKTLMHGPPLMPPEIRRILIRSVDRYVEIGLDRPAAIAATARKYGTTGLMVMALVDTVHAVNRIAR